MGGLKAGLRQLLGVKCKWKVFSKGVNFTLRMKAEKCGWTGAGVTEN